MALHRHRLRWWLVSAALVIWAAPASASARPAAVSCGPASFEVSQAGTGRVSGCVRLGPLSAGAHALVLQQLLPSSAPPAGPAPGEPAVALTLSPAAGRPGTVVTVTGRLRQPFHPRYSYPTLCWDGCRDGIADVTAPLHWTSSRTFRTRLVVPAAPWIEQHPNRVAPLADGGYPIGIDCIRSARDCAAVTEGSAMFALRRAHRPAWCRTSAGCARLAVSPATARPSDVVRISGDAPLTVLTGSGAGSLLTPTILRARGPAPAVAFATSNGVTTASFGRAAVRVQAPPSYASLPAAAPISETTSGPTPIAADPAEPSTVASCAGATIAVSTPAGATAVPTGTVNSVLRQMGFARLSSSPDCVSVAPVDDAAGAMVGLAASFTVTLAPGGPPFYDAAVVTDDGGRTWTPLPVPPGSIAADLGGFRYAHGALTAVFATSDTVRRFPEPDTTKPLAEVVGTDGLTWRGGPLGCPDAGPCVTLGPYLPGNCAMNGTFQPVLRSSDGGRSWSPIGFPYEVQGCDEAELAVTSARSALLVDSTAQFPVLRTTDGGIAWHDVGLPPRPGHGEISVLPDGSLLSAAAPGDVAPWALLRRHPRGWCRLRTPDRAQQGASLLTPVTVIGDQLWWLTGTTTAPAVHRLAIAALAC